MVMAKEKIKNPLLRNFLKQQDNLKVYEAYLERNSAELKEILNQRFKKFYYKIRIISYFSKLIDFESINFDKKNRERNQKFNLILDKPSESGDTLVEQIEDQTIRENNKIEDIIPLTALKSLTNRQKLVLELWFYANLNDTEIGNLLGVSQQSISKTKQTALQKLRWANDAK